MSEIARWMVRLEIPFLSLTYLYFILTDQLPLAAVVLIALIWTARAWLTRRLTVRTLFDLPILLLLLLLPISLWASSNWFLTLPKIYGILLSAAFFYAIVNHIETPHDISLAIFCLGLLCLAITCAGLIGTDWAQSKIVSASFIYDRLPRIIQNIPRSIAGGFARNGIGGTLTFTIPFLAAILWESRGPNLNQRENARKFWTSPRLSKYGFLFAFLLSLVTLLLTQSRGGILGTVVGLIALLVWKKRRLGVGMVAAGIIIALILLVLGQGTVLANLLFKTEAADGTLASRLEVWQRGVMMVQDFPFTGIGLGTYNVVAHALYPFFIAAPDEIVPHAHNQFLQVAVDLGIPGLVAYVAMLGAFIFCAVRAFASSSDARVRALIVGLSFGILAHHVFGLTDAFILGSKPGLLLWIYFALAAACYVRRHEWAVG